MCAVLNGDTGSITALGEDAVGLEGKLAVVRPFWNDRIVDRGLVRALLQEALQRDVHASSGVMTRWLRRYTLRLPETTPALHARWLRLTCQEVWPVPWKVEAAYADVGARQIRTQPVRLILDLGFSSLHVVMYVGNEVVLRHSFPQCSVRALCERLQSAVFRQEHVRIPVTQLYGQSWFTQLTGFDERASSPVMFTLSKALFERVRAQWGEEIQQSVGALLNQVPAETRAPLIRSGVYVLGGGAETEDMVAFLRRALELPVEGVKQPKYATLRARGV